MEYVVLMSLTFILYFRSLEILLAELLVVVREVLKDFFM